MSFDRRWGDENVWCRNEEESRRMEMKQQEMYMTVWKTLQMPLNYLKKLEEKGEDERKRETAIVMIDDGNGEFKMKRERMNRWAKGALKLLCMISLFGFEKLNVWEIGKEAVNGMVVKRFERSCWIVG
jgi:hypothetical protein